MFSGQENTETTIVNNIVYNLASRQKESICIFPCTQSGLGFACRRRKMKSIAPSTKKQHAVPEMESFAKKDKNRADEHDGSRPNR